MRETHNKTNVTCVTLSKEKFDRPDLKDFTYLNHVSTIVNEVDFKKSHLDALRKVNTKFVFFCDHDDPLPETIVLPVDNMVYGDFHYFENHQSKVIKSKPWNFDDHLLFHGLIHKPVLNTENAISVIELMPDEDLHFHFAFYFLLSFIHGSEYHSELKVVWMKNKNGRHKKAYLLKRKTTDWLKTNAVRIKEEFFSKH